MFRCRVENYCRHSRGSTVSRLPGESRKLVPYRVPFPRPRARPETPHRPLASTESKLSPVCSRHTPRAVRLYNTTTVTLHGTGCAVPRPRFYVLRVPDGSKSSEGSRDGRWKSLCERGSLTGEDFRSLLYTLHTSSPSATLLPLARSRK